MKDFWSILKYCFIWVYDTLKGKTETEILLDYVQNLPRFEPIYLYKTGKYYQFTDERTVIKVNTLPFKQGIYKKTSPGVHPIYEAFMTRQLPPEFEVITAFTFHSAYRDVQNETNLLKNSCLKYS